MNTYLKNTESKDIPRVLGLLHELGRSDEVDEILTSESDLMENLYSDRAIAQAKFIMVDEKVAGFLIFSWKWATFTGRKEMYMQAIYISPKFRRKGVAQKAMAQLAAIATEAGCSRIEWYVVKDKLMSNGFYESIQSHVLEHMAIRRVSGVALEDLARV